MNTIRKVIREIVGGLISEIKLVDVFSEYPDEDELIWNYVGEIEFNNEDFKIEKESINNIINKHFIDNFNENAEKWQKKYVSDLIKKIYKIKNEPIIVSGENGNYNIVDGNHRLMAMYLSGG